jgi:DMSO/TMAO reductase YedYZ molybdopterin-dependent catalytic subunit
MTAQATQRFDALPVSICGDVERPARLALPDLHCLIDAELVSDFHCLEGWSRLGERWRGVRLRTLLALAGAASAAGYVTVGSGEYTAVLTREQPRMSGCSLRSSRQEPRVPGALASRGWSDPPSGTAF